MLPGSLNQVHKGTAHSQLSDHILVALTWLAKTFGISAQAVEADLHRFQTLSSTRRYNNMRVRRTLKFSVFSHTAVFPRAF